MVPSLLSEDLQSAVSADRCVLWLTTRSKGGLQDVGNSLGSKNVGLNMQTRSNDTRKLVSVMGSKVRDASLSSCVAHGDCKKKKEKGHSQEVLEGESQVGLH